MITTDQRDATGRGTTAYTKTSVSSAWPVMYAVLPPLLLAVTHQSLHHALPELRLQVTHVRWARWDENG